jgi:hypothetical protein
MVEILEGQMPDADDWRRLKASIALRAKPMFKDLGSSAAYLRRLKKWAGIS